MAISKILTGFSNEPLLDFSDRDVREGITSAIKNVRAFYIGENKVFPAMIAGKTYFTENIIVCENPSNPSEIIGKIAAIEAREVDIAVKYTENSTVAREWSFGRTLLERAPYLRKIAKRLRNKKTRLFFIALMVLEVGKSAPEADAEVCEAIDFLEYYASCADLLQNMNTEIAISPEGEKNDWQYLPIGYAPLCVSIQPWNFPLAISVGPMAAAFVSGYSVAYKPAEQSSITGYYLSKLVYESGIPKEIFHFLPGIGEETGKALVSHPGVSTIAFTGSKDVCREIKHTVACFNYEELHLLPPHKRYEKHIAVLESGGKNVMIVDMGANIDEVVLSVTTSFLGFQGQKCSAGSILIIVDPQGSSGEHYRTIVWRLVERVQTMPIGTPEDPKNLIGPLIDALAFKKVIKYINIAKKEGKVTVCGKILQNLSGYFVRPVIVENVDTDSRIAQEEIFGPVLIVFSAKDFVSALEVANGTEFGLTGGVWSSNNEHLELARREFRVGNLYLNKQITGATVGRQEFGGIKMSGNGTKAGGWDYLLSFLSRRAVSENTMRVGIPMK